MRVVGIQDGFRGLVENRTIQLDDRTVSGILTLGGTILGTSRDKPHKMLMGGKMIDMTQVAVENARSLHLDCLVCLGGGGTQKNALRLFRNGGINVLTLPKTIDNDVWGTDITFGYDTAMQIATEAIDRLHTTATSHHRIIVCEIMGHSVGWLALSAGIAGGADVILIPELPYDLSVVADYLLERRRSGKRFSIIAVAEGALSKADAKALESRKNGKSKKKNGKNLVQSDDDDDRSGMQVLEDNGNTDDGKIVVKSVEGHEFSYQLVQEPIASRIARQLQELTGAEARVTSLGHVQRGGTPSAFDRFLSSLLGTRAAQLLAEGKYQHMVGYRSGRAVDVPLEEVAGKRKVVPLDHPMIETARLVGTCLGDK